MVKWNLINRFDRRAKTNLLAFSDWLEPRDDNASLFYSHSSSSAHWAATPLPAPTVLHVVECLSGMNISPPSSLPTIIYPDSIIHLPPYRTSIPSACQEGLFTVLPCCWIDKSFLSGSYLHSVAIWMAVIIVSNEVVVVCEGGWRCRCRRRGDISSEEHRSNGWDANNAIVVAPFGQSSNRIALCRCNSLSLPLFSVCGFTTDGLLLPLLLLSVFAYVLASVPCVLVIDIMMVVCPPSPDSDLDNISRTSSVPYSNPKPGRDRKDIAKLMANWLTASRPNECDHGDRSRDNCGILESFIVWALCVTLTGIEE